MFRTRGAVVLVVVAALAAGACGGTDWNAAHKPNMLTPAQLRAAAAGRKRAELSYVNALVAKYSSDGSSNSVADDRCIASAIVHGFGVAALMAHRVTPTSLGN